jgi:hypothetical protein
MFVPVTLVNQEIRLVAQFHLKSFRQQLDEKIIRLAEVVVEVAEIDADFFHVRQEWPRC